MILFAGSEERGYFLEEPAKTKKMKVEYLGNAISIETQLTAILEKTMQYLVLQSNLLREARYMRQIWL